MTKAKERLSNEHYIKMQEQVYYTSRFGFLGF